MVKRKKSARKYTRKSASTITENTSNNFIGLYADLKVEKATSNDLTGRLTSNILVQALVRKILSDLNTAGDKFTLPIKEVNILRNAVRTKELNDYLYRVVTNKDQKTASIIFLGVKKQLMTR